VLLAFLLVKRFVPGRFLPRFSFLTFLLLAFLLLAFLFLDVVDIGSSKQSRQSSAVIQSPTVSPRGLFASCGWMF